MMLGSAGVTDRVSMSRVQGVTGCLRISAH